VDFSPPAQGVTMAHVVFALSYGPKLQTSFATISPSLFLLAH